MKIKSFFRWYDLWVGIYIDKKEKAVYICPLPMIGVKIYTPKPKREEVKLIRVIDNCTGRTECQLDVTDKNEVQRMEVLERLQLNYDPWRYKIITSTIYLSK